MGWIVRRLLVILAAVAAPVPVAQLHAQTFPAKPVRIIVPFPAGGPADALARIVGEKLERSLGKPFVVDDKAGAGGNIGMEQGARAAPDGYTLVLAPVGNLTVAPALYAKLPYDPEKDFAPITVIADVPNVLIVHPSVPAKNVKEFIALAKSNPGRFSYATSSPGSINHLAMELLQEAAGIDVLHVPYKGTGAAMTDLLSGQIQMTLAGIPPVQEFLNTGRLRALAVSGAKRAELLPDTPSFVELGYGDVEVYTWTGLLLPSHTPTGIVTRWHSETVNVLREPAVKERFRALGVEPVGNTPAEFAAFLKAETAKWARAVKKAGINLN